MEVDLLGFFQERMARAYEEQVWAIALVVGMNAFIAGQAAELLKAIKYQIALAGIVLVSSLALLFVWSRHFIYAYYNELTAATIKAAAGDSFQPAHVAHPILMFIVSWSGVTLYTLIIFGMCLVALKMLQAKHGREGGN